MKYPVIEDILPREETDYSKVLNNLSDLIDEAIDFGTNLLKWELDNGTKGDEQIVALLFFRNILSVADGISILIRNSSVDTSKPLVRVLLESIFNLEYLLQDDTEKRALSFFVWNAHKDLKFLEQIDFTSEAGKQTKANITKDKFSKDVVFENRSEFKICKENTQELLKLPQYIPIEEEYQRTVAIKKNPNWFSLFDGPSDYVQLASKVNLDALYQFHYRSYSRSIHSTNVHKDVFFLNPDGTSSIIQIRNPKDSTAVAADTANFLLMTFMTFQRKLLIHRHDDFLNWYGGFRTNYLSLLETIKNR